jgi:proteic killer suppression protein
MRHDNVRGVDPEHAGKLRDVLARLDAAGGPADMDLPGFRLLLSRETSKAFGQ